MDKGTFFKMMKYAREQSGNRIVDVAYEIRMQVENIRRVEKGESNCRLTIIFPYLKAIKYHIRLTRDDRTANIYGPNGFRNWIAFCATEMSQKRIIERTGYSVSHVKNTIAGNTTPQMEQFLKWVEVFGYKLILVKNPPETIGDFDPDEEAWMDIW